MPDHDPTDHDANVQEVDLAGLQPSIQAFAPLSERQGLFVHSFQCMACLSSAWPAPYRSRSSPGGPTV